MGLFIKTGQNSPCWRGVGKLSSKRWSDIKLTAKKRGIKFDLDIEYAWSLFKKQNGKCKLSGIKLKFPRTSRTLGTASLDRIDSKKGYIRGNIQWVHKKINMMKYNLTNSEFKKLCKRVANK